MVYFETSGSVYADAVITSTQGQVCVRETLAENPDRPREFLR
jgi:hypothetical protein